MNEQSLVSYITAFTKRAQEYGLTEGQAYDLCKQHTSALEQLQKLSAEKPAAQPEAKPEAAK